MSIKEPQSFTKSLQNPRAPCISNMTWQKVQLTEEAAAEGDAAHSSRNG